MKTDLVTFRAKVMECLDYNPETGVFRWKIAPKCHPRMKGQVAGYIRSGYRAISIEGKQYTAHRLAWLIVYGVIPELIDHVNRDPDDNRIANLREADRQGNAQNHSFSTNGSGLPVGVRRAISGKYVARIRDQKRAIHIGTFDTPEEAAAAYQDKRKQLFGEFCPR